MADKVDFGPRLGADPEFFVSQEVEGKKKKVLTPICGLVGGTKEVPIQFDYRTVRGCNQDRKIKGFFGMQEDNVMLELNVPATYDSGDFRANLQYFLKYLQVNVLAPKKLHLEYYPTRTFRDTQLAKLPQAERVGCQPDFCAYNKAQDQMRPPFNAEQFLGRRFCGGHFHLEYNWNNVPREIMVQLMDLVGLQFIKWDQQGQRRQFYGKAGIYRPKSYGVEYRTLSNFWTSPNFIASGYLDRLASSFLHLGNLANHNTDALKDLYRKIPRKDLQKAIETEDHDLALEILNHCAVYSPIPIMLYNTR